MSDIDVCKQDQEVEYVRDGGPGEDSGVGSSCSSNEHLDKILSEDDIQQETADDQSSTTYDQVCSLLPPFNTLMDICGYNIYAILTHVKEITVRQSVKT